MKPRCVIHDLLSLRCLGPFDARPLHRRVRARVGRLLDCADGRVMHWITALAVLGPLAILPANAQSEPEYELPPILYSKTAPSNRVAELQRRLDNGAWSLPDRDERQILQRCLTALEVSPDTQVLVFSKTSLQRKRIHPQNPRAIYFADDGYVGWVPGGLLEVAVTDPNLGLAFYQFDPQTITNAPRFQRSEECLSCHGGAMTRQWPGLIVRSVFPDANGEPISSGGGFRIEHDNPLEERWGGWYVTGHHGTSLHMGNVTGTEKNGNLEFDRAKGANRSHLAGLFPTDRHLRPDSDIVALMVLEHQVGMHNRLVEGALRVRKWTHYQRALQKELGENVTDEPTGTALRVVENETHRILEYMLFATERALPAGGLRGGSAFQEAFRHNRRSDPAGRSLKDFNLSTRLFVYRCSYMIYSHAFESLPKALKERIAIRLDAILTSSSPPNPFQHLDLDERRAIREILIATKPDLTRTWATANRN